MYMYIVTQLLILYYLLLVKLVLTSTTACIIIRAVVLWLYIQEVGSSLFATIKFLSLLIA